MSFHFWQWTKLPKGVNSQNTYDEMEEMALRNLDDLSVFVKAVDCQGFSAAARALDLSPTTVSKQVARLEKALGISLFERSTRRLKVTDEGRQIAQRVRGALELLDEAAAVAHQSSDMLVGTLRLTAPVPLGSRYVAPAIAAFRELHPRVGFELQLSDHMVDLYAQDLDLAIRLGPLRDSQLLARRLATSRRILVAAPAYLQAHDMPGRPRDLAGHPCLLFAYPGLRQNRWILAKAGKPARTEQVEVSGSLSSDNGEALRAWCLAGLGISLRESWDVADDLATGRLMRVLPDWEEPGMPISAVHTRRAPIPRRLSTFIEFLAERWRTSLWDQS